MRNVLLCEALPKIERLQFYEPESSEVAVEFRLIYQGPLPAEKWSYSEDYAKAQDKHRLRKHFHKQLRELWKLHPDLRRQMAEKFFRDSQARIVLIGGGAGIGANNSTTGVADSRIELSDAEAKTWLNHIADSWQKCGGRFVPLISKAGGFTCSLDILFLRRGHPGDLISTGGDIDNRIKVLLDGLTMPNQVLELGGLPIEPDENPFFCLLQDESLVTSLSVTTDRLLTPHGPEEKANDVFLIIHVTVNNPGAIFAGGRLV